MKCLHVDDVLGNRCTNERGYKTSHFGKGKCHLHEDGRTNIPSAPAVIVSTSNPPLSIYREDYSIDTELLSEESTLQEIRLLRRKLKGFDEDDENIDNRLRMWAEESGEKVPAIEFSKGFIIAACHAIDRMIATNVKINRQYLGKREFRELVDKFTSIFREVLTKVLQENIDDPKLFYKIYDEILLILDERAKGIV